MKLESLSTSLIALICFSVFGIGAFGGALPKRVDVDNSPFGAGDGKPKPEDVLAFTKDLGKGDLYFKRTFALVAYALVGVNDGEQVKSLFKEAVGQDVPGLYELTHYDPVTHEPSSTVVGFDELTDISDGSDIEDFKHCWWIAALWGVMKSEWDSYYEPIERKVTNKGEAYQGAMTELDFFEGWVTTPTQLGREIDGKAAHWLMTVLLKRNIVVSRYGNQKYNMKMEDVHKLKDCGATLWVGNAGGVDTGDAMYADYVGYWIQDVQDDDGHSLVLKSPREGEERNRALAQNIDQQPFFFHLKNLDESWSEDWYQKTGLPTINDI